MGRYDRLIEALEALPDARRSEIVDLMLELTEEVAGLPGQSQLTTEQLAEVRGRQERGFRQAAPDRIDRILAKYR